MLIVYALISHPDAPNINTPAFWGVTAYLGFLGTTLAFLLYLRGLEQIGAARTSIFLNFVPIFSVLTSNIILQEPITWPTILGGALALTGVRLLN